MNVLLQHVSVEVWTGACRIEAAHCPSLFIEIIIIILLFIMTAFLMSIPNPPCSAITPLRSLLHPHLPTPSPASLYLCPPSVLLSAAVIITWRSSSSSDSVTLSLPTSSTEMQRRARPSNKSVTSSPAGGE